MTTIRPKRDAARLAQFAEELGCLVEEHWAQTGTIYLTISHERLASDQYGLKVRVADHGDAHGTADYTADGFEGTPAGARRMILNRLDFSDKALRRLRRARRARANRRELVGHGADCITELFDATRSPGLGDRYLIKLANGELKSALQGDWPVGDEKWRELREPNEAELAEADRKWPAWRRYAAIG